MQIKWKNTLIFFGILALLGGLVYLKFNPSAAVPNTNSLPDAVAATVGKISTSAETVSVENPPEPQSGVLKAVILVGASGFDSFSAVVDKQGNYKVVSKKFGVSLVKEGLANPNDVTNNIKSLIAEFANQGVQGKDIHFLISSGALKETNGQTIAASIKKVGFVVNEITANAEGAQAYKAAMHPAYKDKGFVVDVGSGNTKIAWMSGGQIKTAEGSGAKYFQNGKSDEQVFNEMKALASKVPADKREICFVIGGSPNSIATSVGNSGSRYLPLPDLNNYTPKDKKEASGATILKGIQAATNTQFIHDVDANFSIGFLVSLR